MNFLKYQIALIIAFLAFANNSFSQSCSKKKLADKELKQDFDYRGQTLFREMQTGESAELNIILYSKQNYRIFVMGEQKLGKLSYQVIVPRKKFTRVLKEVKKETVPEFKKDPSGFYLYDTEGKRIPDGDIVIMDTIWERETTSMEELVYDSNKDDYPYWEATPRKTQQIKIKVMIEETEKPTSGCVGLYVGKEFTNTYQFRR